MSGHVGSAAVGGLVVRNGRYRGTRVPLKLPVTVIGKGDGCDVRLSAEGIAPLHCVIAITPAGPTVRAWVSENTFVNGEPTAAAVLQHGDELRVGPCSFRVQWYGDIAAAEPEEPALETGSGPEWNLKEREAALTEQERQIAALLEAKQQQVYELLDQLAGGRGKLHAERDQAKKHIATAAQSRAEIERMLDAAERTRQKNHTIYRKLIERAKRHRAEGEKANVALRTALGHSRTQLESEWANYRAERAQFHADVALTKSRLEQAWQMLEDGQRRLHADRQEAEATLAEYQDSLDARSREIETREETLASAQKRIEARCADLLAEIAGLEQRAMHANLAVQELEQKRVMLEAHRVTTVSPSMPMMPMSLAPVPLDARRDRSFDELMTELHIRERDLANDQKAVSAAKAELARLADDMTDQRAVLAEQFSKLSTAARHWKQAEATTVSELEQLAAHVEARELAVQSREQRLVKAEESTRTRERELWNFRVKLEGWQAGLTAHESQWYATRDRTMVELDRKREHLAQWEHSLDTLCKTWNDLRAKERDAVRAEQDSWAKERAAYLMARTELDAEKVQLARQAKQCAVAMTTAESLTANADEKKLRVLRKRWESHFTRFERLWEARQKAAQKAANGLDERFAELRKQSKKVAEEGDTLGRAIRAWDVKKLAFERTNREKDAVYSMTVARAKRSDRELVELRSEVERVAASLLTMSQPTGEDAPLMLQSSRAA